MAEEMGTLRRRFSLASVAALALAVFALASAPTALAQETLAASCGPPPNTVFAAGAGPIAQNFISGATGNLSRAEVSLRKTAGTTQPFTVEIRTVDSGGFPTEVVLASGTILAANVSDSTVTLVSVGLTPQAPVAAGQQYALVVSRPGSDFLAGVLFDDTPPVGEHCPGTLKARPGTTWGQSTANDLVFRVFVTPLPSAAPGLPSVSTAQLTCKGRPATLVGTAGNDLLIGTNGPDVIVALGGNDTVSGLQGEDLICGGKNKDTLKGGGDEDTLLGQKGADSLKGGGGNDTCKGGKGRDVEKSC